MIVHGIPGSYRLKDGDILSIDCGAIVEGYHGDAAFTMAVGEVSAEAEKLITRHRGQPVGGHRPDDRPTTGSTTSAPPSRPSPRAPASRSCGSTSATPSAPPCTRTPRSPTTGRAPPGPSSSRAWCSRSSRWSTPAGPGTRMLDDGWSVVTADGSLSAHFEHTIAVTDDGPEVLTLPT